jgi:hypothetical protein
MLKKAHVFGLLAAALAIAPGTAFAGQLQNSDQNIEQTGVAIGRGNTVVNQANQQSTQNAYHSKKGCHAGASQGQNSRQNISQSGAAIGEGNTVVNTANQSSVQNAAKLTRRGHRYGYGC